MSGVMEVAATTDRRTPILSASLQREFPPPATYDHLDANGRSNGGIEAYVEAPVFNADAVAACNVCERYTDGEEGISYGK